MVNIIWRKYRDISGSCKLCNRTKPSIFQGVVFMCKNSRNVISVPEQGLNSGDTCIVVSKYNGLHVITLVLFFS